ncbi:hypothetical protein RIL73_00215 (plasmid) [Enterobacter asburiae]|uniref:hypothetical protein n=1 Tax=Enterobacter cloacae complex TaxID=354276 RepID=UPI00288BF460|nr:hypothetical protein [Enterobacter asburiae]WNI61190.1 hypothetical protein RIL73_00215 [Enterobacter asburiae]
MIDDDKSGQRVFQVGALLFVGLLGAALYLNYHAKSQRAGSIASCSLPTGNFDLRNLDGRLQPVDESTGKVIGFLERRSDGQIQLTTADGFAPNVTPCLSGKLSTEQLNSLPLHE